MAKDILITPGLSSFLLELFISEKIIKSNGTTNTCLPEAVRRSITNKPATPVRGRGEVVKNRYRAGGRLAKPIAVREVFHDLSSPTHWSPKYKINLI